MRPADIDRTDRRRLLASLAVTAVFYALLYSALFAFGDLMPDGLSSPGRKGSPAISIRLAADGGRGAAGKDSIRRESRRTAAPESEQPPATVSQNQPAKPDLPQDAASLPPAAGGPGNSAGEKNAGDTAAGERSGETDGSGAAGETAGQGEFIGGTTGGTPAFISWLDQAIRTKLAYPEKARNRNIEGTVTILAEVSADGKVCMASIRQSSGSSILDRAAVSFVKSLFPSPVSPRKSFSGTLRIRYILTREGT